MRVSRQPLSTQVALAQVPSEADRTAPCAASSIDGSGAAQPRHRRPGSCPPPIAASQSACGEGGILLRAAQRISTSRLPGRLLRRPMYDRLRPRPPATPLTREASAPANNDAVCDVHDSGHIPVSGMASNVDPVTTRRMEALSGRMRPLGLPIIRTSVRSRYGLRHRTINVTH